jgi:hypothetical protein
VQPTTAAGGEEKRKPNDQLDALDLSESFQITHLIARVGAGMASLRGIEALFSGAE